jgi:RNA polymerase sigma-70 factor (ECF subfamily)
VPFVRPEEGEPAEAPLVEALRAGDEEAFQDLVDLHHASMVRVARLFLADRGTAEEVAQDAWLGVLRGLPRFRGRSSLKTWIFRILVNRAKSRRARDGRSRLLHAANDDGVPSPERSLLARELRKRLLQAVESLGPAQRAVITLRDLEGCSAAEARGILGLSEANQRVLLHRARSAVRRALESYFSRRKGDQSAAGDQACPSSSSGSATWSRSRLRKAS